MIRRTRIVRGIADMTRLFSFAFLVPVVVAFLYDPWDTAIGPILVPGNAIVFLATAVLTFVLASTLRIIGHRADEDMVNREAYLTVGLGWLVITVVAAIPFYVSGTLSSPIDAFFEAMSGITTTGASAFAGDAEALPASISFWRALLQWLGGIGIIVLFVALISGLTHGGITLFQAEASSHLQVRLRPKIVETARVLWRVYAVVSLIMATIYVLLFLRIGIDFKTAAFDAVYHTFTTYATGGFSSHAASIGHYNDVWVEIATIIFMLVGATSFPLMLALSRGNLRAVVRDPQWRLLMGTFLGANLIIITVLIFDGSSPLAALRGSAFSVATTLTGTGLVTADFSTWPVATHIILLMLMLMGGNAGSTSGAIKSFRFLVLGKVVLRELRGLLHPRAVIPIRVGGRVVPENAISTATAFFFTYVTLWVTATVAVTAIDPRLDLISGASATASTIGNVGVGIGAVGPTGSYATLLPGTKVILAALMWFGRLELFTAMLVFSKDAWKN